MRIISDFHDYYDSAMALGQDKTLIYERKRIEFDLSKNYREVKSPKKILDIAKVITDSVSQQTDMSWANRYHLPSTLSSKKHRFNLTTFSILFCGKIYKGVNVTKSVLGQVVIDETKCFYNKDSLVAYLVSDGVDLNKKTNRWVSKKIDEDIEIYYNTLNQPNIDWLIEQKVTCVLVCGNSLVVNPKLSEYEFFKLFDTYSCFNELAMWMGGVLSWPQNFMVEIDDKYKILEHGFDPKYGFRTRPHDL